MNQKDLVSIQAVELLQFITICISDNLSEAAFGIVNAIGREALSMQQQIYSIKSFLKNL